MLWSLKKFFENVEYIIELNDALLVIVIFCTNVALGSLFLADDSNTVLLKEKGHS